MEIDFESYERFEFARNERILKVTLAGLGPANAVDELMHQEFPRLLRDLQDDAASDLVILTGRGGAFCAGGDMDWFKKMIDDPREFRGILPDARRTLAGLLDLEKPVVCRLNGHAAGFGASIALLCDIVIADERAKIGDPHVKVGLVAGDGGAIIWPQLVGYARAKEYLLTGELMTATAAVEMGLINYAVPGDELDAKVDEMVAKVLANPRWAVRWTKAAINIPLRDNANKVSDAAFAYEMLTNLTRDRQEAVDAFVAKRAPKFEGE
ncbi:MAG: enoyl-CoA hydratase-related protein [Myxococcota bacterium]|jgi:enoyl-CoA hydratase|nr:enoyl-CoA hydratase-related protein [Myxococcota bacterium]